MKAVHIVFILIFLLLPSGNGFADDNFTAQHYALREAEIRQFSAELFTAGEYYRAITEARRYLSLFPKVPRAGEMAKMIGDAYLLAHEWTDAIVAYDDFLARFPDSPLANDAVFHRAVALVKQGNAAEAERLFQLILGSSSRTKRGEAARWEILLLIRQNHFDEAERLLRDRMLRPEIEQSTTLIEGLIAEKKEARYKSPATAGLLSAILPGSGQVYNERYRDGITSFVLNGLFIVGAWKAFDSENHALGAILTLFEVGWYGGNVYGAIGGAHKYNRQIDEDHFRRGLQRLNLRQSELGRPAGVSVMFTYPF
ncbi:MAG: tetratricopeptide repeat protein [Proteobacteria bacterium]|nr:tetratricopeptide repeat protein [Pseudomonadota bacterium]